MAYVSRVIFQPEDGKTISDARYRAGKDYKKAIQTVVTAFKLSYLSLISSSTSPIERFNISATVDVFIQFVTLW